MRSPIDTGPPPADERSASRPGHAVGSTEEPPAGSAVGNLAWSVSGEAVRLLGSFGAFLILVRIFSPAQLGLLIAATALFAMLYPFAGLGGGWLVLQRVTKEAWTPGDALAVANGMTLVGSLVVGLLVLAARPLVMPQMPWHLFLGVGVSEMMLLGLVETTLFAAQATERLVAKAVAWSMYGVARAAAATLVVLVVDDPGLGLWILVTIGVGLAVLAVAQYLTIGHLVGARRPRWSDVTAGVPYSIGFGAERLLAATDSVLLVRLDYETDAGLYAAARRLLTVSVAPVLAALHATSARLWRAGGREPDGAAEAGRLALRLSGIGSGYGIAVMLAWIAIGDSVVPLLGETYAETADILAWLSVVPLLLVLEVFAATALTSSGHHARRVVLTLAVGAVNVVLNLIWIPGHGWQGAVYASLVSSVLYVVSLWLSLWWAASRPIDNGGGTP